MTSRQRLRPSASQDVPVTWALLSPWLLPTRPWEAQGKRYSAFCEGGRYPGAEITRQRPPRGPGIRRPTLTEQPALGCAPPSTDWGDTTVADNEKRWQDMTPDEQAVVIRQISGAVNGLQFRVQDLEEAVKALQERLKP
jgi:hypothetical protein